MACGYAARTDPGCASALTVVTPAVVRQPGRLVHSAVATRSRPVPAGLPPLAPTKSMLTAPLLRCQVQTALPALRQNAGVPYVARTRWRVAPRATPGMLRPSTTVPRCGTAASADAAGTMASARPPRTTPMILNSFTEHHHPPGPRAPRREGSASCHAAAASPDPGDLLGA